MLINNVGMCTRILNLKCSGTEKETAVAFVTKMKGDEVVGKRIGGRKM